MERLTARNENGAAYYPHCFKEDTCCGDGVSEKCNDCKFEKEISERLAAYEDTNLTPEQIIEIDRMYRTLCEQMDELQKRSLPCNVGDIIWELEGNKINKCVVLGISKGEPYDCENDAYEDIEEFAIHYMPICGYGFRACTGSEEIGKTIFLSESEAQEALERMVQND